MRQPHFSVCSCPGRTETGENSIRFVLALPYFLGIGQVGTADDEMGPVLCLSICLGNILSHQSKAKQLNSANQCNYAGRGSPSCYRIAKQEAAYDDDGGR